jgi:hypothetical protein
MFTQTQPSKWTQCTYSARRDATYLREQSLEWKGSQRDMSGTCHRRQYQAQTSEC